MTIKWSEKADADLKRIFKSFEYSYNKSYAKDLVNELENRTLVLVQYPEIGQTEELLGFRNENFRYLVEGNYKIIYWIDEEVIRIVSVFDTRQNPEKLKNLD
jgi:toxin ParE1/3/4